ncbi:hypothetical protein K8I61_20080 [bacterium]|nr:hypothetical protein [bacterium]
MRAALAAALIVFSLSACSREAAGPPPFDPALTRLAAMRRVVIGYPGARNDVVVDVRGSDGERVREAGRVRLACRGARVVDDRATHSPGLHQFIVEPEPGAREAVCRASVERFAIPRVARFSIVEPCSLEAPETETDRARDLARRYAPVFYQDTGRRPREDFLTSIDFDGNIDPTDNRENLQAFPLVGAVYYGVSETATHVFIHYAYFHPVSYGILAAASPAQPANDMGAVLVVASRSPEPGPPEVVETYYHGEFLQYAGREDVGAGSEDIDGRVLVEDHTHARIFISAGDHGALITSEWIAGEYLGDRDADFPGGDGVVYRAAKSASEPESANDRNATYKLVSIIESIWKLRGFVGERGVFASTFRMDTGCEYPESIVGRRPKTRGGRPLWAFDDPDDEDVRAGEWFFWPAHVIASHLTMPHPFSRTYTSNPFLGIR